MERLLVPLSLLFHLMLTSTLMKWENLAICIRWIVIEVQSIMMRKYLFKASRCRRRLRQLQRGPVRG